MHSSQPHTAPVSIVTHMRKHTRTRPHLVVEEVKPRLPGEKFPVNAKVALHLVGKMAKVILRTNKRNAHKAHRHGKATRNKNKIDAS